jgi:serine/threonine protein kinase
MFQLPNFLNLQRRILLGGPPAQDPLTPIQRRLRQNIATSPYHIVGQGTYGTIIQPALPNVVNDRIVEYPQNVSKIFRGQPDVQDLERFRTEMIAGLALQGIRLPEGILRRYSMYPYRYRYSKNNMNASRTLRNIRNKPEHPSILRLPYLGESFYDIVTKERVKQQASTINYRILCEQILDCMVIVQAIKNRKYVHGDLRETNVMLHPGTGEMTIIDFDWFRTFQDYGDIQHGFPHYMYYLPPECIFIAGFSVNRQREEANYRNVWESVYQHHRPLGLRQSIFEALQYCKQHDPSFLYDSMQVAMGLEAFLQEAPPPNVESNMHLFESQQWERLRNRLYYRNITKCLDSFGLAVAFRCLFNKLYETTGIWNDRTILNPQTGTILEGKGGVGNDPIFRAIRDYILATLIPNMMHSNMQARWDIDRAIQEFKQELTRTGIHAFAGGRKGRNRSKTRQAISKQSHKKRMQTRKTKKHKK